LPRVQAILADRGYRGLARLAARKNITLDIKAPPPGTNGFAPIRPLYKVEHAFARLGRWRRLSRCYEGTEASAQAWLEVAAVAYMFGGFESSRPDQSQATCVGDKRPVS
jgi:transposase